MSERADPRDLRAFERARWSRQAAFVQRWLGALPAVDPDADALALALAGRGRPDAASAQMRHDLQRDLGRLRAALAGKTPTAVDDTTSSPSTQAFARDEAVHTADNALAFLTKVVETTDPARAGAAIVRAQRWLQRLHWELSDTGVAADVPTEFSAEALAAWPAHGAVQTLARQTARWVSTLRAQLAGLEELADQPGGLMTRSSPEPEKSE